MFCIVCMLDISFLLFTFNLVIRVVPKNDLYFNILNDIITILSCFNAIVIRFSHACIKDIKMQCTTHNYNYKYNINDICYVYIIGMKVVYESEITQVGRVLLNNLYHINNG